MATKRKMQIRYGAAADRPTLATGELGLDTDTGAEALYVGTPAGNKVVASMGVKKYVALLTQSGTSAPVATVLENSLGGTVVWARSSAGTYTATLASAFTENKTVIPNDSPVLTQGIVTGSREFARTSANALTIITYDPNGNAVDDYLSGGEQNIYFKFEVVVYP